MRYRPDIKVFKAQEELQKKAGKGTVKKDQIENAQKRIKDCSVDFAEYAQEHLSEINRLIYKTENDQSYNISQLHNDIKQPLMGLKSGSGVYGYDLVGDLANIMFNFVVRAKIIDEKMIQIIKTQNITFRAIVSNKMTGDGGQDGMRLKNELHAVCENYLNRNR